MENHALSRKHYTRVPPEKRKHYPMYHKKTSTTSTPSTQHSSVSTINIHHGDTVVTDNSAALRFALQQDSYSNVQSTSNDVNAVNQINLSSIGSTETDAKETDYASTPQIPKTVVAPDDGFRGLMNKFKFVYMHIKRGIPMQHVAEYSEFIHDVCGGAMAANYSSGTVVDEIIYAMNSVQVTRDRKRIKNAVDISLTMDNSSFRHRSVKILADRQWVAGIGPRFYYGKLLPAIKSRLRDGKPIPAAELRTVDSSADVVATMDKVLTEHYQTGWSKVHQICLDGASQNVGVRTGAIQIVCLLSAPFLNMNKTANLVSGHLINCIELKMNRIAQQRARCE